MINVSNLHAPSKMYSLCRCAAGVWENICRYLLHTREFRRILWKGISRFHGLGALFFLISNLYRFIIAVLLLSAFLPLAVSVATWWFLRKLDSTGLEQANGADRKESWLEKDR